jgi:hypothetical protein
MQNKIASVTVYAVGAIALAAFSLSFDALRVMAANYGVNPWIAWLFPFALDLAIVVYSVAAVIRRMRGLDHRLEWIFAASATLLSVLFNAVHDVKDNTYLKILIHSMPPLMMWAAWEIIPRLAFMKQEIRKATAKAKKVKSK